MVHSFRRPDSAEQTVTETPDSVELLQLELEGEEEPNPGMLMFANERIEPQVVVELHTPFTNISDRVFGMQWAKREGGLSFIEEERREEGRKIEKRIEIRGEKSRRRAKGKNKWNNVLFSERAEETKEGRKGLEVSPSPLSTNFVNLHLLLHSILLLLLFLFLLLPLSLSPSLFGNLQRRRRNASSKTGLKVLNEPKESS